jgi:hypothetical protein
MLIDLLSVGCNEFVTHEAESKVVTVTVTANCYLTVSAGLKESRGRSHSALGADAVVQLISLIRFL